MDKTIFVLTSLAFLCSGWSLHLIFALPPALFPSYAKLEFHLSKIMFRYCIQVVSSYLLANVTLLEIMKSWFDEGYSDNFVLMLERYI